MTNKKVREKMKRALAALLTAGLVVTGMPGSVVEAANESIEQTLNEEETAGAENPGGEEGQEDKSESGAPGDSSSEDDKSKEEGDALDEQTPGGEEQTEESGDSKPGMEDEDKDAEEDDAEEEESEEASDYSAQISGNDLMIYGEKELPEYSLFVVNPLFEDILDADELKAETALLQEKAARDSASLFSGRETAEVYATAEEAADYVRGQMVDRANTVEVYVVSSLVTSGDDIKAIVEKAISYTPECTGQEGDALERGYKSFGAEAANDGKGNYLITYTFTYYTTYEQEQELTYEVNKSLASLNLDTATEYQKIRRIYDYICDHVNYDYDYEKYSAYDALCTGEAVCQGYAVLFYRMCKDTGLSVRIIRGQGYGGKGWENHAWNIIRFGEKYYNVDATWDGQDEETRHNYFMLNEKDFVNHIREEEQQTDEFYKTYPMALVSYIDESDFEEKFEKSNYAFNFTSIEDKVISSTAEGKPKLLIFFNPNDNASALTIQNIAEQAKEIGLTGVDIYAIGAAKSVADKKTVEDFKNTYGGDNITFAYDADSNNFSRLSQYVSATGNTSFSYPVICYIDEHNKFQYLTMGKSNASVVKANLIHYCDAVFVSEETPDLDHSLTGASVSLTENDFTYNGTAQEPEVEVMLSDKTLVADTDYEVTYTDNTNAGTATVTVTGKGAYTGTATATFEIKKAPLTLKAKDITMQVGDAFPPEYGYEITAGSLMAGDSLKTPVSYKCTAENSETAGTYEIEILNAKVGDDDEDNYEIKCEKGILTISDRPAVSLEDADISLTASDFTYNGKPHTPAVAVTLSGTALTAETDYEVTYTDNTNAGTATVAVTGKGAYTGTATTTFAIKKAPLTIKAEDVRIKLGEKIPSATEFKYVTSGLIDGESLTTPPTISCTVTSSAAVGVYEDAIVPADADAGDNYVISYENGTLTIVDEYIYYTVTFDVQGRGTKPAALSSVREGTKIDKPAEDPTAEGYRFTGWYKDAGCKTAWDFENDVVEENLILYAGWEKEPVALQEENVSLAGTDLTYNKTAQKPTVVVMVSGEKLAEGTDYTLTCENNVNAGTAIATVTGKGDYTGTVSKDFTIKKAPINVWAKDKTILIGDPIPVAYEYGMDDLFAGDTLLQEPTLSCDIEDTDVEEEYEIVISGADAGSNYEITLVNGTLRVVAEYTFYTVTFDVQGHGTAPAGYDKVQIGDTITKPVDPTANGYRFGGWYQDAACTIAWDFDRDTVQEDLTLYAKWVRESKEFQEEDVALEAEEFVYDGTAHRPKVVITVDGVTLVEGRDYRLSYKDNINVGIAAVHVFGLNDYIGCKITKYFTIAGLSLVVRAKNKVILIGDPIPMDQDYEYEVIGLAQGDKLTKEPSFACSIKSSAEAGKYDIVPYGAVADNYSITYEAGILTVADEYVAYTVSFDMQGHGPNENYIGVKAGSTISMPMNPTEEGYRFDGWYRDKACTKAWDFDNDIVQTDLVLYAKWLRLAEADTEDGFAIQEIGDMYYTGKPCKPVVSVYDGETLLKAGRDYQIKYYNHTNANKDGVQKQGNGTGTDFNPALPYVEIIGKGNYTETVRVNYNILRASIGDGGVNPAAGVTFKAKDQLVAAANKSQKPFTSIKYVKAMKLNVDYTLSLRAVSAKDAAGNSVTGELDDAAVPAGYSGEFLLTVAGQGNYDGSVCKTIYVADKAHLIKNAAVTLGKNQKNVTFSNKAVELTAAEADSADTFTVKCGRVVLKPGQDYTVSYQDNDRVGKAKLIITGTGAYAGSKTVPFTIKGAVFSAKTVSVSGIEDKAYAGGAWTQNNAVLTYTATGQRLIYGMDYTISYSRNINKGTATMAFKGIEKAGYSGSFRKTFKIMAVDINRVSRAQGMEKLSFAYSKAGVKPVDEIVLTDQDGYRLKNGRDYTLRYVNNKAVADKDIVKPPMVIVKGKGNYVGEFSVPFQIVKADLRDLTVKTTPVEYKGGKGADYAYQPAVKLMDGKSALRAGRDYEIEYRNNTQAAYEAYMNPGSGTANADTSMEHGGAPVAVIKASADSSYSLPSGEEFVVSLQIYQKKLNKAEFRVEPEQALYTGGQVRPAVKVYYGNELLTEGEDYTISYGKNIRSGKNQGSVTINGAAPKFGGSITVKFDIVRKPISY